MIKNIHRRHKGFITGALVASLLWLLGVMYVTYTTTYSYAPALLASSNMVKFADIQKKATDTVQHARRAIDYKSYRILQKEKPLPPPSVTNAANSSKSRQSKISQKLKSQQIKHIKTATPALGVKFKPWTSVSYKTEQTVSVSVNKLQTSRSPLFINEQPVAVMGVDFWMEAGRTSSDEDRRQKEAGFTRHAFNQYASDRLGYFRDIPDTRHNLCRNLEYPPVSRMPNTSIIICFHNEAQSALLRTVYSVIQRSPAELIHEIILVDDASTFDDLKDPLDEYIAKHLPIVMVVRTSQREGLIRARLLGARHATGTVLTFLDSHCEVNRDWLLPLLTRLMDKPTEAVVPVIDVINQQSLAYTWVGLNKGGFDWGLSFKWHPMNEHTWNDDHRKVQPFRSPAMAGGLFSIYRDYFFTIGSYDDGMDIWGGENIEISLRLWMCGGGIEIVPCSRVGHIFRSGRPYSSPGGDTMGHNVIRVAEVWLDDYKEFVYKKNPLLQTYIKQSDVSSRVLLRKKLQCHSFEWYLKKVYPELMASNTKKPSPSQSSRRIIIYEGLLRSASSHLCLTLGSNYDDSTHTVTMTRCDGTAKNQEWRYTDSKQVAQGSWCLQPMSGSVVASPCKDTESNSDDDKNYYLQLWLFDQPSSKKLSGQLFHVTSERCLHDNNGYSVTLDTCNNDNKWTFMM